jgi:pimeloyl-ACP methyl ester carboxylesterase
MPPQPSRRTTHAVGGPKTMLVYDRWGRFGRPVLLLHGLLFDRTMWWPVAADLTAASSCTVIAPDLPGHGQTPPREDYGLERIARDLAVLLNGLDLHRAPIVVGHGVSARLAEVFAASYATQAVRVLDEPPAAVRGVDAVIGAAGLDAVPAMYRPYARPRPDGALLTAYASWLEQPPTRRNQLAVAGHATGRPESPPTAFAHLADPEGFAAELRDLL